MLRRGGSLFFTRTHTHTLTHSHIHTLSHSRTTTVTSVRGVLAHWSGARCCVQHAILQRICGQTGACISMTMCKFRNPLPRATYKRKLNGKVRSMMRTLTLKKIYFENNFWEIIRTTEREQATYAAASRCNPACVALATERPAALAPRASFALFSSFIF